MLDTCLDDPLLGLLIFLPVPDIARVATSCRRTAGHADSTLWRRLCERLWAGKLVAKHFRRMREAGEAKEAYRQSLADSRRVCITQQELTRARWSFRFKSTAGEAWQENDPWWQGKDATQVRFRPDGSACFKRGFGSGSSHSICWRFVKMRSQFLQALEAHLRHIQAGGQPDDPEFSCRLLTLDVEGQRPCFSHRGVRAKVSGREVPTYCVRRHPDNWGWVMESCWVLWTSWPMPRLGSVEAEALQDSRLPVTVGLQHMEAMAFNLGIESDSYDDDNDASDDAEDDKEAEVPADDSHSAGEDEEEEEAVGDAEEVNDVVIHVAGRYFRMPRALLQRYPLRTIEMMIQNRLSHMDLAERTQEADEEPERQRQE